MAKSDKKSKTIKDRLNEAFGKMTKKDAKDTKGGCNCDGKGTCKACRANSCH